MLKSEAGLWFVENVRIMQPNHIGSLEVGQGVGFLFVFDVSHLHVQLSRAQRREEGRVGGWDANAISYRLWEKGRMCVGGHAISYRGKGRSTDKGEGEGGWDDAIS